MKVSHGGVLAAFEAAGGRGPALRGASARPRSLSPREMLSILSLSFRRVRLGQSHNLRSVAFPPKPGDRRGRQPTFLTGRGRGTALRTLSAGAASGTDRRDRTAGSTRTSRARQPEATPARSRDSNRHVLLEGHTGPASRRQNARPRQPGAAREAAQPASAPAVPVHTGQPQGLRWPVLGEVTGAWPGLCSRHQ